MTCARHQDDSKDDQMRSRNSSMDSRSCSFDDGYIDNINNSIQKQPIPIKRRKRDVYFTENDINISSSPRYSSIEEFAQKMNARMRAFEKVKK
jgi:hypothetical protein